MNEQRAEERRQAREEKKTARRKDLAAKPVKQARRRMSLRGQVQMHDRLLGALLMELRQFTIEIKQATDIHAMLIEVLTKQAGGRELTEEDKDVIRDYLENYSSPAPEEPPKAEDDGPGPGSDVPAGS